MFKKSNRTRWKRLGKVSAGLLVALATPFLVGTVLEGLAAKEAAVAVEEEVVETKGVVPSSLLKTTHSESLSSTWPSAPPSVVASPLQKKSRLSHALPTDELLAKVHDRLVPLARTIDMERYEELRRYHGILDKIAPGYFHDIPLRIPPTHNFLELETEEDTRHGLEVMGYYHFQDRTISLNLDALERDPDKETKMMELLMHEGSHALEHNLGLKSAFSTLEHTGNFKKIHDTLWARAWDQRLVTRDLMKRVSDLSRKESWGVLEKQGWLHDPLKRTDWLNRIVDIPSFFQEQGLGLDHFPFPAP